MIRSELNLSRVMEDKGDYGVGPYYIEGVNGKFKFSIDTLSTHLFFLGSTGTGKTNAIFWFVHLIKKNIMTKEDVMIIFDTKGDYLSEFYDSTKDIIIDNTPMAKPQNPRTSDPKYAIWNLFLDIMADGEEEIEANANEVARTLYDEDIKKSRDPFFPRAAADITRATITALLRDAMKSHSKISNKDLVNIFKYGTISDLYALLKSYPDLKGVTQYIELYNSPQTQGVISTILNVMNDIFIGNFSKDGDFSIRDFIRNKGGRTLFIEYDLRWGRILTPIYRVMLDMAIKESLGRHQESKGNVYFIIDEFALLPNLYHIDDGINFGRSQGAKFIIGTQNVNQILESYGQGRGISILSNFGTLISFRLNDEVSKNLVLGRYGKYVRNLQIPSAVPNEPTLHQIYEANYIESSDLSLLPTGTAIICPSGITPRKFQFRPYH